MELCASQSTLIGDNNRDQNGLNCMKLNPQTPYFDGGLQQCKNPGVYYYMSTRNNNFSNRSQKGTIVVLPCKGEATCANKDAKPADIKGDFDPFQPEGNSASALFPQVVAVVFVVLALLF